MRTRIAVIACLAAIVVFSAAAPARACTAFSVVTPEGALLAKGFDWVTGEGWIVVNERGRVRSALVPGASHAQSPWTARFASLSLTTVGPGFPIGGMNEEGLAIEALVDLSERPTATPEPGALTGLELVQYGLDRFATVGELASFARGAHVTQLAVALHFLACDRSGECVAIEPRPGGAKVTRTTQAKALANRPYAEDLEAMRPAGLLGWLGLGRPMPGGSADRFRTVARALEASPPKTEPDALSLLEKVVMRHRTQWQLVWNLERRTVLLRQREAGLGTRALRFDELDLGCSGAPRVLPLGRSAHATFAPWSERDAAAAEQAVLLQAGGSGPEVHRLASVVAAATRSSGCRSVP